MFSHAFSLHAYADRGSLIKVGHFNHLAATLSTLNKTAQRAIRAQVKPYTPLIKHAGTHAGRR